MTRTELLTGQFEKSPRLVGAAVLFAAADRFVHFGIPMLRVCIVHFIDALADMRFEVALT